MTTNIGIDEFEKLFYEGKSRAEIAEHFGISVDRASRLRKWIGLPLWGSVRPRVEVPPNVRQPRVSDEEFVQMCKAATSLREVLQASGYHASTARRRMEKLSIPPFATPTQDMHDHDLIAELLRAGLKHRMIAERVGCTVRAVQRVAQLNPELRRNATPVPLSGEELQTAREMLEDGASYVEVARTLKRSQRAIHKHFPNMGWTPRQAGEYSAMLRHMEFVFEAESLADIPGHHNGRDIITSARWPHWDFHSVAV